MRYLQRLATLSTCLMLASTAFAQDAAAPTEGETAPADQTFPVAKEPANAPYLKEKHGSWNVVCVKPGDVEKCVMSMRLMDASGNPTADLSIEPLPEGQEARAGATLITPLSTLLPPGVAFSIDSDRARRYQFAWCDRGGCVSQFGFTEQEVGYLQDGTTGKLTIVAVANPANPLSLDVPLDGFKAAWTVITKTVE